MELVSDLNGPWTTIKGFEGETFLFADHPIDLPTTFEDVTVHDPDDHSVYVKGEVVGYHEAITRLRNGRRIIKSRAALVRITGDWRDD